MSLYISDDCYSISLYNFILYFIAVIFITFLKNLTSATFYNNKYECMDVCFFSKLALPA